MDVQNREVAGCEELPGNETSACGDWGEPSLAAKNMNNMQIIVLIIFNTDYDVWWIWIYENDNKVVLLISAPFSFFSNFSLRARTKIWPEGPIQVLQKRIRGQAQIVDVADGFWGMRIRQ